MSASAKRVVLYRFDRQPVEGHVRPDSYLGDDRLEFLTSAGDIQLLSYSDVKAVCFVSDPARPDLFGSNAQFERRPKMHGLWVRFILRDGDLLDGVLSSNLTEWPVRGFLLTPPRSGPSRQRVFLPRGALHSAELLGLMGASRAASASRDREAADRAGQLRMFDR